MQKSAWESRSPIPVERLPIRMEADEDWVVALPFFHGGQTRVESVIHHIEKLTDVEVDQLFEEVTARFGHRHHKIELLFDEHYAIATDMIGRNDPITLQRQRLIGSYFTMEYAIAAAALFNPSIVPHPNQQGVPNGGLRFLMSLRATGEGHLSSVLFRTGVIHADQTVELDPPRPLPRRARSSPDRFFIKQLFAQKLQEMGIDVQAVALVMDCLQDRFTLVELEHALADIQHRTPDVLQMEATIEGIRWLARENYRLRLPADADISQMVIFPQSDNERRGIEDVRMVRFVEDDGAVVYYATYTAYDGYRALPQLMETADLHHIDIFTMNGACVQNKGMALFPRRINGHYVMCSRNDGVNLFIMYSDIVQFWETAEQMRMPQHPWEYMQIGNCGSPIETSEGWLLLTHGVGPMRTYSIGAMLLDRDDPLKVVGHLDQPLLIPNDEEREGYTPNVVYTCGSLVHGDHLYMPYAMSDAATGFAVVELKRLLERLCG